MVLYYILQLFKYKNHEFNKFEGFYNLKSSYFQEMSFETQLNNPGISSEGNFKFQIS